MFLILKFSISSWLVDFGRDHNYGYLSKKTTQDSTTVRMSKAVRLCCFYSCSAAWARAGCSSCLLVIQSVGNGRVQFDT